MKIIITAFAMSLLCLYVYYKTIYRHRRHRPRRKTKRMIQKKDRKKILNLVLFSHGDVYDQMKDLSNEFYKKDNDFVDTIYYTYHPDIQQEYSLEISNHMLYIRGTESYIPGILRKTIKAFEFVPTLENLKGETYDYIVRTNISTLVDFDKLEQKLKEDKVDYASGLVIEHDKDWLDPDNGIDDERYAGIPYPSGTSMIFSRKLFNEMYTKFALIDEEVIDDVSIGKLVKLTLPQYELTDYSDTFFDGNIINVTGNEDIIFYRNKSNSRNQDLVNMKKINDIFINDMPHMQ